MILPGLSKFSREIFSITSPALCLLYSAASFAQNTSSSQNNYVAFELARDNNWEEQLKFEDLNGDGLKDIIHANYQKRIGRELHVFYQQADGSFSPTPQRIGIKTEIIAVGFADLRPQPGKELVLFSNSGVFSLSSAIEGYAGNIKTLFEWDLIAAVPDLEHVQFIADLQDIDQDGEVDLLLPGDGVYGLFKGKGNETFELVSTFSTDSKNLAAAQRGRRDSTMDARIGINAEEGVVIVLDVESQFSFDGFLEQWDDGALQNNSLLRAENWMPSAIIAHLNGD